MGMYDTARFNAPNLNSVVPDLQNFLEYNDSEKQKQMQFEKDMMNFQSNLRLKEMSQAMDQQRIAKSREPLNVAPPTGLITPAMAEQNRLESERTHAIGENNMVRNQIAQQNANTRRDIGEETLDTRRDIADKTLSTRKDIAEGANTTRENITDKNITGRSDLETQRQGNRVTNLNTKGNQIMNQIHARGAEDRTTKATPSPNVRSNDPSQQAIAEKSRANQFINTNPDLGKWVSFDPNTGMVSVTPPSNKTSMFGKSGPTTDEYHRILGAIYGNGNSYGTESGGTVQPPNTTTPPTGNSGDKVRVMLPDGRIGTIPRALANQPGIKVLGGG